MRLITTYLQTIRTKLSNRTAILYFGLICMAKPETFAKDSKMKYSCRRMYLNSSLTPYTSMKRCMSSSTSKKNYRILWPLTNVMKRR